MKKSLLPLFSTGMNLECRDSKCLAGIKVRKTECCHTWTQNTNSEDQEYIENTDVFIVFFQMYSIFIFFSSWIFLSFVYIFAT